MVNIILTSGILLGFVHLGTSYYLPDGLDDLLAQNDNVKSKFTLTTLIETGTLKNMIS